MLFTRYVYICAYIYTHYRGALGGHRKSQLRAWGPPLLPKEDFRATKSSWRRWLGEGEKTSAEVTSPKQTQTHPRGAGERAYLLGSGSSRNGQNSSRQNKDKIKQQANVGRNIPCIVNSQCRTPFGEAYAAPECRHHARRSLDKSLEITGFSGFAFVRIRGSIAADGGKMACSPWDPCFFETGVSLRLVSPWGWCLVEIGVSLRLMSSFWSWNGNACGYLCELWTRIPIMKESY